MKTVLTLAVLSTLSIAACGKSTSQASSNSSLESARKKPLAQKFICIEFDDSDGTLMQKNIVLTPKEGETLSDGGQAQYKAEIFEGAESSPDISATGTVKLEDVTFAFTSNDKKVEFTMYLDEMSQSSLTINGKDAGQFICR